MAIIAYYLAVAEILADGISMRNSKLPISDRWPFVTPETRITYILQKGPSDRVLVLNIRGHST
jgi:hypothetical protein